MAIELQLISGQVTLEYFESAHRALLPPLNGRRVGATTLMEDSTFLVSLRLTRGRSMEDLLLNPHSASYKL